MSWEALRHNLMEENLFPLFNRDRVRSRVSTRGAGHLPGESVRIQQGHPVLSPIQAEIKNVDLCHHRLDQISAGIHLLI